MITKFLAQFEKKSMLSVKMMKLSTFLIYNMGLVSVIKKFLFRVVCKITPYCGTILAPIGIPTDIPVVWEKWWLKKSVVSENGMCNYSECWSWFCKLLKAGWLSSLYWVLVWKRVASRAASKGLLCDNILSCSLQRKHVILIFWVSRFYRIVLMKPANSLVRTL